ncbi:2-succinyl-5-enolpyruvyl-6-hydroxy-3-cyclohexene-1-carboxylic-acid synthase [Rothia sp. P6271]|uniref:2-succinyl-5-enolpyruvyl-6-hydroxy-3- cyclohexene-1-carboxylic-acid synthase n=1 Tax=Rothia sp. P6271 TaxID=3402659 RepID=UPI003ABF6E5E
MTSADENAPIPESLISAISVLDSLVRTGMEHIVLCPGSRSAPLAYAIAALEQANILHAHVRLDERSASFLALGIAKATQRPVAVVTTSGTAVGELLPAMMEAFHSGIPLLALTADRPQRLRGTGANQTTYQPGIFTAFVRAQADLTQYPESPAGEQTQYFSEVLAALSGRDPQNWNQPSQTPIGPAHINLSFDTPLTPPAGSAPLLNQWANTLKNRQEYSPISRVDTTAESFLAEEYRPQNSYKTVVIAGDGAGSIAEKFARKLSLPLLAEPSSHARYGETAIEAYPKVLDTSLSEEIERVVLFGHPTLTRQISSLLQRQDIRKAIYMEKPASWCETSKRDETIYTTLVELAEFSGHGVTETAQSAKSWLQRWKDSGRESRQQLLNSLENYRNNGETHERLSGMSLALEAWNKALEHHEILVCGSSNIIRDLDLIAPSASKTPRVYASRGLAGIDGMIATASGISLGGYGRETEFSTAESADPVHLICGDLTYLYDVSSLNIGAYELTPQLHIDVLDDCGGGIFSTLEHGELAQDPAYTHTVERFFRTPHRVRLEDLAHAYQLPEGMSVTIHHVEDSWQEHIKGKPSSSKD